MPQQIDVWTEPFRVRTFETDLHGHASVQTLCNYFQETAGKHALSYGVSIDALKADNLTWVLGRLRVHIDAYPAYDDEVTVETWPSGIQGLLATRDFLFHGAPDEQGDRPLLGRGTSAWLIIDAHRRRPVSVAPFLERVTPPVRPRAIDDTFAKLPSPTHTDHECRFRVRYSDLDVNRHVNNVRYAEWAVESVPEDVLQAYRLSDLELHFRAETLYGDMVFAHTQGNPDPTDRCFIHRLVRDSDGRDVAAARTRWVPRA